jgi:hypothetical protein
VKLNWISLISAILIFLNIGLPYLSASFYILTVDANAPSGFYLDFSHHISLSIYYFGFVASANGITKVQVFPYWFNWLCFALILVAGTAAIGASFAQVQTRKRLMALAGVLGIICSPLFLLGFFSAMTSSPPNNTSLLWFSPSSLGLTQTEVSNLHSQNGFPFFWLLPVVGIWALLSTKVEIKNQWRDRSPQQT